MRNRRRSYAPYAVILAGFIFYLVIPYFRVISGTHPDRASLDSVTPADRGLNYEDVTFDAADGVMLSGWYIASRCGPCAGIILTHGYGSNRVGMLDIAEPLAKCGFSILMYDTRNHGLSEAAISSRGWTEVNDVLGAVTFLQKRVDKIGAFGSSIGGQTTIRAAAQTGAILAVATDGASTAVFADEPNPNRLYDWLNYPAMWVFYKELALSTGQTQPVGVTEAIPLISPRPILLISSGQGHEQQQMRKFYEAAEQPKMLWEIPDVGHVQGIYGHPEEFKSRIVNFFSHTLLNDASCPTN